MYLHVYLSFQPKNAQWGERKEIEEERFVSGKGYSLLYKKRLQIWRLFFPPDSEQEIPTISLKMVRNVFLIGLGSHDLSVGVRGRIETQSNLNLRKKFFYDLRRSGEISSNFSLILNLLCKLSIYISPLLTNSEILFLEALIFPPAIASPGFPVPVMWRLHILPAQPGDDVSAAPSCVFCTS